jgi:hypothetical protein
MGAAKNKKLIESVRKRAFEQHNGLYVPKVEGDKKTNWPVCMTCHGDVDAVNVEDIGKDVVTIRARCHGEESVIKMEFPFTILNRKDEDTWHHVQTAINNAVFFDPSIVY